MLHIDALKLVIVACDTLSMLVLSIVNRRINQVCDRCWGERYMERYGREALGNAKIEYKKLVFSSGRVIRYSLIDGATQYIEGSDKIKYAMYGKEFYINAHGECSFQGIQLGSDVLDIGFEPTWNDDTLFVLTRSHVYTYTVSNLELIYCSELTGARRLVIVDDECHPEMENGDLYVQGMGLHTKRTYRIEMQDGQTQFINVRRYNVVHHGRYTILLTEDGFYVCHSRHGSHTVSMVAHHPIITLRCIPCEGGLLLLTEEKRLIRYSWDGEMKIVANNVLPNSLIESYNHAFFVQWYI